MLFVQISEFSMASLTHNTNCRCECEDCIVKITQFRIYFTPKPIHVTNNGQVSRKPEIGRCKLLLRSKSDTRPLIWSVYQFDDSTEQNLYVYRPSTSGNKSPTGMNTCRNNAVAQLNLVRTATFHQRTATVPCQIETQPPSHMFDLMLCKCSAYGPANILAHSNHATTSSAGIARVHRF